MLFGLMVFTVLTSLVVSYPTKMATPVIYNSDLYHPFGDDDDIFDAAILYSLKTVDIKLFVLDMIEAGYDNGQYDIMQLNYITGKNIPWVKGLTSPLTSINDQALTQPSGQNAVQAVLDILQASSDRVDMITVGSARNFAAAYNRNPQLFRDKAGKIIIFAGDSGTTGYQEYNVSKDPYAYLALMQSGLSVYWCPCFDGGLRVNNGTATWWTVNDFAVGGNGALLSGIQNETYQFFIYNELNKDTVTVPPLPYIRQPINSTDKASTDAVQQELFCTGVFDIVGDNNDASVFTFRSVNVEFNQTTGVTVGYNTGHNQVTVMKFNRTGNQSQYATAMTARTNQMLKDLPVVFPLPKTIF